VIFRFRAFRLTARAFHAAAGFNDRTFRAGEIPQPFAPFVVGGCQRFAKKRSLSFQKEVSAFLFFPLVDLVVAFFSQHKFEISASVFRLNRSSLAAQLAARCEASCAFLRECTYEYTCQL
jgi:hypothetical protein